MKRTSIAGGVTSLVAALGIVATTSMAWSQPSSRSPLAPPANGVRKTEPGDGYVALVGATVHVKPGETIAKATVVMRSGRIEAVLAGEAAAPNGADSRDAAGMHIYAGFIEPYFEVDVPKPDPGAPGTHWNAMVTPQRNALDKGASGIASRDAELMRSMGFVAAAISPKGGIFRGSGSLVSLSQASSDPSDALPRVYSSRVYNCVALDTVRDGRDEAPATPGTPRPQRPSEDGRWNSYPGSQMGSIALIRQTLSDAAWRQDQRMTRGSGEPMDALDALSQYQLSAGPSGGVPHDPGTLLFDVDDELEALRAAKIAKEFGRACTLLGSGMEFRRLDAIKATGLPIVLPLNFPRAPRVGTVGEQEAVELRDLINWEQAPTNPRRLDAAGMTLAFTTSKIAERGGSGGRRAFKERLGTVLKHGLKPERALAMLTTNSAQLLGVADQFGTVEKGKVASLIVADGELFTDKPDAPKKGEPGYVRAGRIVDVYVDGRRHSIAAKQRRDLGGTWALDLVLPPASGKNAKIAFEIDDDYPPAITIVKRWTDGEGEAAKEQKATSKAQGVSIDEDGRYRFTFEHEPFGEKGVYVTSGVIEKDELGGAGGPLLRGETIRSGGGMMTWTAKRVSTELPKPEKRAGRGGRGGGGGSGARPDAEKGDGDEAKRREAPAPGDQQPPDKDVAKATPPAADKPGEKPVASVVDKKDEAADDKDEAKKDDPKKSKTPEADVLATIPEKLGLPLGPYAMDALPVQEDCVISNATIWTAGGRGVIENGRIAIKDGKIAFVGTEKELGDWFQKGVFLKQPWREIDAQGKHITPGIIDCHSHTGISRGVNEGGQAVTAEVRIGDVTDPDSISWYRQLGGGVTTVNNLHGSSNPIGGQNQVNKNRWGAGAPDDLHFAGAIPGIKFALGENVKQSNGDRATTRYPASRMGVEMLIRDRFTAAREYLTDQQEWEMKLSPDARAKLAEGRRTGVYNLNHEGVELHFAGKALPRRDLELEALAEIIEGKRLIHCHAYRQDEILMLCRVADEFGFKIGTFQHGLEVYKVAEVVKNHAIGASLFSDWWAYKVEVQDAIPYAGPMQTEVGVMTSYNSDSDEMARRMNVEAGKAVKYSHGKIAPEEALKFVTLNAAKQLKIDDKVGSIEVGKDADLAIWSGPPLSSLSRCERTFVDGREMFSLEKDAAMRQTNSAERARIMQKVLASRESSGGGGRAGRGGGEGGTDPATPGSPTPTDEFGDEVAIATSGRRSLMLDMYRQQDDIVRERCLRLIQRGLDPRFHCAGECGCEGN